MVSHAPQLVELVISDGDGRSNQLMSETLVGGRQEDTTGPRAESVVGSGMPRLFYASILCASVKLQACWSARYTCRKHAMSLQDFVSQ